MENHIVWDKYDSQTKKGIECFRSFAPIKEHILFYSNVDDFESVSSYSGVEKEVLAENPSGTVTGELANDNVSDIKLYVSVTGEQLTHDVADESLTISTAWADSQLVVTSETLATLTASTNGIIIQKSVEVYGSLGGGSQTLIAADDGDGKLVSAGGILSGTDNTIDYTSSAISLTCTQEFDTLTVTYKYITALQYEIGSQGDSFVNVDPLPGSIVIKMGDEVIAREVYDNDDEKYRLEGDSVESSVSEYDYTNGEFHMVFTDSDMYSTDGLTDHLVIEYSYQIGDTDGSGLISATGLSGTIDPASGDLTSVEFDTTAFEDVINGYDHTVTDLFTLYHIPYADYAGDNNIADTSAPGDVDTAINFTAATGVVDGFIGQQMIESGTASMELGYTDGTTPTTTSITDDGSGNLLDGVTIVGTIDYTDGRIKLTAAPTTGYEMTSAVVSGYSYYNVTSSNKAWVGFFDTGDLNGNYVYAMTGETSSVTGYRVVSYDWSSYTNSYGAKVLNIVFE